MLGYVSFPVMVLSGFMPSSRIAGSHGSFILCFFKGISILFSVVAVSIYIPTNRSIALYSLRSPCVHCLLLRSQGSSASSMAKQWTSKTTREKVRAPGTWLSSRGTYLVVLQHVESSRTRGQTHIPVSAGEFLATGPAGKSRKAPFPLCRASVRSL